mmetsp:Transcript_63944/g.169247  ORF Transcript_63944/g.169247 Transcript_63944/m.169247 type:complete len:89 (-) Transcript_63944:55-321(-)
MMSRRFCALLLLAVHLQQGWCLSLRSLYASIFQPPDEKVTHVGLPFQSFAESWQTEFVQVSSGLQVQHAKDESVKEKSAGRSVRGTSP